MRGTGLFMILGFCWMGSAFGQVDRSALTGTVRDATGVVLPGVTVVATEAASGAERRARTTDAGIYLLPNLPIGSYSVVFSLSGFQNAHYLGIQQSVAQTRTLDPVLVVEGDQVSITEPLVQVDQSTASLGQSIERQAIDHLPLNGRNWASLTALVPGAIDQGGGNQRSIRFAGRGRDENNFTWDGIDATGIQNQAQKAYIRLAIPTSAIAEFRAVTSMQTAEFGDASGAQLAVASASGSNTFHGSAFEFLRNSFFDARSPFDLTQGPLAFRLNQFGANAGGPVRKNKTFFFVTYEAIRQVQDQTLIGFVPSADFRARTLAQSPALAAIVNAYPAGNGAVTSGGNVQQYTSVGRLIDNENAGMVRLDHRFTQATTAFARFSYDRAETLVPLGTLTDRQRTPTSPLNGAAEVLHVFSPSLVNEAKFGVNQAISQTFNLTAVPYTVNVPGFTALNSSKTADQDGKTYSGIDNVSRVRGRHAVKAGVEIRRIQLNEGNSFDGTLTYSTVANFQTNALDSATYIALLPLKRMRKTAYFGYAQDEFRVLPGLTLNAGLRYEFYNAFHETTGRAIPFDFLSCGSAGFCPAGSAFLFPAKFNIDPRVSAAWSPAGTRGRTVLRTGYGIYHEDAQLDDQNFPTANDQPRYSLTRGAQFPNLTYPFDSLLASATGVLTPKDQVRHRKDAYAQEWTLSVQQNLPLATTATVAYLGSKGTNIMNRGYINTIDPVSGLRPYPQFGQIEIRQNNSNSSFQSLQVSLQRFFTRGWSASANYMWSHAINDASLGSGVEDVFPQNVSCRACDRASSDQDARHSFSGYTVYELPWRGPARRLLGGWQVSAVVTGRTGLPVNVVNTRAAAATPDGNTTAQRPNLVPGVSLIPSAGQTTGLWINPAAFATPANKTWGNLGRNAFRGPALWQADTALSKSVALRERLALELRGECFNLFNRAQYGNPAADIAAPSGFGRITTLVNTGATGGGLPRQFEVSARLVF